MFKSSTIKFLVTLNALLFIGVLVFFYRSAMHDLAVVMKDNEAFQERIVTTVGMYRYQLDINNAASSLDENKKLTLLKNYLEVSERQPKNNNQKYKDIIQQAKMDLSKNQLPSDAILNNWFASYMFTSIVENLNSSNLSSRNVAPAMMVTDKKWTVLTCGTLITGMMLTFWLGCMFAQSKRVKTTG